jgi:ribosome-associated translation inhibitor RaiA
MLKNSDEATDALRKRIQKLKNKIEAAFEVVKPSKKDSIEEIK